MSSSRAQLDDASAWLLLLALARRASAGDPILNEVALQLGAGGEVEENGPDPWIVARPDTERGWSWASAPATPRPELEQLLDLYMPLCVGPGRDALTIAHLAQTLDGRIATTSGKSQFITGKSNLVHAHRLRALSDAVLVGWRTVLADDPQLTTRHCVGPNPVRVIVDPERRLGPGHRVFSSGSGPTLILCTTEAATRGAAFAHAEVVGISPAQGALPIGAILAELGRRRLRRIYIEGGGVTVSRFLEAGALMRLQITVAPVVFGSGLPALTLPEIQDLSKALTLQWRPFVMGADVLFDCTVRR